MLSTAPCTMYSDSFWYVFVHDLTYVRDIRNDVANGRLGRYNVLCRVGSIRDTDVKMRS